MYGATNRVVACSAAVAAVGLAGCSASVSVGEHLNSPNKAISGILSPTPKSVRCPDDISPKAGTTFTCQVVTAGGKHATVSVLEYKRGTIKLVAINGTPVGGSTKTTG
jgi:hypothetical protein